MNICIPCAISSWLGFKLNLDTLHRVLPWLSTKVNDNERVWWSIFRTKTKITRVIWPWLHEAEGTLATQTKPCREHHPRTESLKREAQLCHPVDQFCAPVPLEEHSTIPFLCNHLSRRRRMGEELRNHLRRGRSRGAQRQQRAGRPCRRTSWRRVGCGRPPRASS